MNLDNMEIAVIGLGKSGSNLLNYLDSRAKAVYAFDANLETAGFYNLENFKNTKFFFSQNPTGEEAIDLVVISPGIPLDLDFVQTYQDREIPIIGEVELAYEMSNGRFVGITGTNGKTTTTALTGEIFKNAGLDARVVGNIGNPIISEIESGDENTVYITELSSFQLETIKDFKCDSAAIVNITPDHLNRHKTMNNYRKIKSRIFENQGTNDYSIINLDDPMSTEDTKNIESKKIFVSVKNDLSDSEYPQCLFIKNGILFYKNGENLQEIIQTQDIFLKGQHNYENVLIATGLALSFNIDISIIKKTLIQFKGVEHRLEFVTMIHGVSYVNDSKGTNPDASIKAIEAIEKDIVIIVGGMDKKSDFDDFTALFPNRVKNAILLGETKEKIAHSLDKFGFKDYIFVKNMEEAVDEAAKIATKGDTVLLSPACASWDMYSSFEERGNHFKRIVSELDVKNVK